MWQSKTAFDLIGQLALLIFNVFHSVLLVRAVGMLYLIEFDFGTGSAILFMGSDYIWSRSEFAVQCFDISNTFRQIYFIAVCRGLSRSTYFSCWRSVTRTCPIISYPTQY